MLAVAHAPDGRTLALAFEEQSVQLCSLPGGEVRPTLNGHTEAVICLAFSRDGKAGWPANPILLRPRGRYRPHPLDQRNVNTGAAALARNLLYEEDDGAFG